MAPRVQTSPRRTKFQRKYKKYTEEILDNIPLAINRRLSETSSDADSFERAAPLYQDALSKIGYQHQLKFQPPSLTTQNKTNSRSRLVVNVILLGITHFSVKMSLQTSVKPF